jgi:S-adenosylmethionine synthetase
MTEPIVVAESVLPGHPDKVCDRIADLLVDAACARDPRALVGVEVALHRSMVVVTGCLTTAPPMTPEDVDRIVRGGLASAGYGGDWPPDPASVRLVLDLRLEELSDDLRHLRSISDDQAICIGWAGGAREDGYLPAAHRLAWQARCALLDRVRRDDLGPDGKVLVAARGRSIEGLSLSIHHRRAPDRTALWRIAAEVAGAIGLEDLDRVEVNGGGDFDIGGPQGDNGLSGKKLVVDAYGPSVPIGGGAWSGKDPHKVDRCGALRARHAALRGLRLGLGATVQVTLGWRPGDESPSHIGLESDGVARSPAVLGPIDWSIEGTWRDLRLGEVGFASWSDGGWFQRGAPWQAGVPAPSRPQQGRG